jgi:hypothetical protein
MICLVIASVTEYCDASPLLTRTEPSGSRCSGGCWDWAYTAPSIAASIVDPDSTRISPMRSLVTPVPVTKTGVPPRRYTTALPSARCSTIWPLSRDLSDAA